MKPKPRTNRWIAIALLLTTPLLTLGAAKMLGWSDATTVQATLIGIAIAAIGGLVIGALAERFLHRGRNEFENIVGLVATTALGVLTIGYLYLSHIRGPMASIGSLPRAIRQGLSFLEFLCAQGAGILIAAVKEDSDPAATP